MTRIKCLIICEILFSGTLSCNVRGLQYNEKANKNISSHSRNKLSDMLKSIFIKMLKCQLKSNIIIQQKEKDWFL